MPSKHYWAETDINPSSFTPPSIWIITFNAYQWPNRNPAYFPSLGIIDVQPDLTSAQETARGWLLHRQHWHSHGIRDSLQNNQGDINHLNDLRTLWRSKNMVNPTELMHGNNLWIDYVQYGQPGQLGYEMVEMPQMTLQDPHFDMEKAERGYGALLKLPLELRQQIYGMVFANGFLVGHTDGLRGLHVKISRPGILTTSRLIYEEARIVLSSRTFVFYRISFHPDNHLNNHSFNTVKLGHSFSAMQSMKLHILVSLDDLIGGIPLRYYHWHVGLQNTQMGDSELWEKKWVHSFAKMISHFKNLKTCKVYFFLQGTMARKHQKLLELEFPWEGILTPLCKTQSVVVKLYYQTWMRGDWKAWEHPDLEKEELNKATDELRIKLETILGLCQGTAIDMTPLSIIQAMATFHFQPKVYAIDQHLNGS
ncbi:uncharacterized protein KY384_002952 [Bacidia gigantensis]|uniref:uncharacterized protein n=1 Tax=Bacidia gigantensis TaxID=2732470 RepID=UPI001D046D09|nr:uncharacterized protein KY384_002952 [Bacidia gigantensis]KAG8531323.1 hypothetical protein KY384_002952 [Bacidia gigantensis]